TSLRLGLTERVACWTRRRLLMTLQIFDPRSIRSLTSPNSISGSIAQQRTTTLVCDSFAASRRHSTGGSTHSSGWRTRSLLSFPQKPEPLTYCSHAGSWPASPEYGTSRSAGFLHPRSEEHTSELQSRGHLVCRLLLEKKKYR